MARATAFNPSVDGSPITYLDKMRRNEERRKEQERRRQAAKERQEIIDATQRQALARDPAQAGIDTAEMDRQGGVKIERDKRDGKIIRAEREGRNVFCQLGRKREDQKDPTLEPIMVDAGNRLITIYAIKMGLAGRTPREDNSKVDEDRVSVAFIDDIMTRAVKRWRAIVTEFGRHSKYPQLFELLCQDAMETEATLTAGGRQSGKSRWRTIVSQVMNETEPHAQAGIIRQACAELVEVLKAVEGGVGWKD